MLNEESFHRLPQYNHNSDLEVAAICIYSFFSLSLHLQLSMSSLLRFSGQAVRLTAVVKQSKYATSLPLIVPIGYRVKSSFGSEWNGHQQYRGHKNFGHKPTPIPNLTRLWHFFTGAMIIGCLLNYKA